MRYQPDNCVDLVFGSPPYEAARTYGIGFKLRGQEWVDWMVERIVEMVRICKGLVAMVVEGQTRKFQWSAAPALLMADLHRRGVCLRKPPAFHRVGICGSGGPDWLRNDYEFIVCATSGGKLRYSDNTAMGKPCRYGVGGAMSNRTEDGRRRNRKTGRRVAGGMVAKATEPKARRFANGEMPTGSKLHTKNNGTSMRVQCYVPPELANPGNVIHCTVGGSRMGSQLAHENEAPFPERLAEFFVRSFCPPGGIVLDPFSGSGTTARVAHRHGRQYIALDVRQSQCELTAKRLAEPEKPAKKPRRKLVAAPSQKSLFAEE
jgi:hypothetical protein